MKSNDFKLYVDSRFTSPYAMSVFVTLAEKGLSFDVLTVDLGRQANRLPDYAALSLSGRVPTLIDGAFHLSESSAITEYLEERFPSPAYAAIYPRDVQQRARARQIQAWLRSDFFRIREERSTEVIFYQAPALPLSAAARVEADRLMTAADSLLGDDTMNLFDAWCIADTELALMLNRLLSNGDAMPEKLAAYVHHQWQRSSLQGWINQQRGDCAFA